MSMYVMEFVDIKSLYGVVTRRLSVHAIPTKLVDMPRRQQSIPVHFAMHRK